MALTFNVSNTGSAKDATERMRITSDGIVQIYSGGGTSEKTYSATAGLQLYSQQSDSGSPYTKTSDIVANGDGTVPSELRMFTKASGSSTPTERMRITSGGDINAFGVVSQSSSNNYNNILVKSGSTGTYTFTQTELNGNMIDNVSYFIFVSVYRPTLDVTSDVGTLILHGIMPRGGASVFNTISTVKGGGISVLTATNSNNSLVITTDSGTTFRCALKIISMGGTS